MNKQLPTFKDGEDHVKISHFTRQGIDIRGVIHVGTNDWYEYDQYVKMGIENLLGFEPLTDAIERFKAAHPTVDTDNLIIPCALGSQPGLKEIYVTKGDGQSSSFLTMTDEYNAEFPDIEVLRKRLVPVVTFDHVMQARRYDLKKYNCMVIDVEGYELEVLRGMKAYISYFDVFNIECSGKPTYHGGPTAYDVLEFLDQYGYKLDSHIEAHNDVMFYRKGLLYD